MLAWLSPFGFPRIQVPAESLLVQGTVCEMLKCRSVEVTIGSQKGLLISIAVSVNTASFLYMHKALAWYLKSLHYWKSVLKRMPKNMKCSLCLQAFKINMKSKKLIRKGEVVLNTSIKQWRKKKEFVKTKSEYMRKIITIAQVVWKDGESIGVLPAIYQCLHASTDPFPEVVNPGLTPAWNPEPTCTLMMLYTGS